MKPTRSRVLAAATVPLVLTLVGCGGNVGGDASGDQGRVAAVIKGLDNPFFQAMRDGLEQAASDEDVKVEVQAAQSVTDTTGQAEKLSAVAQQDFGCYIVNPISGNNLVQGLAQITDKPIVNIDQPIDAGAAKSAGVDVATYIGTDNKDAGALAGKRMNQLVKQGKVALIGGTAGDVTSKDRLAGFSDAIEGKLEALPIVAADWNRQQALTTATDLLNANPDLKGIFAANDDMALGAARAVANAGKADKVAVIGVDGNEEALKAVKSGRMTATVAQYPYAVGQLGMEACAALADGEDIPKKIVSPVALVTADNADKALSNFPEPFEKFDNPLD